MPPIQAAFFNISYLFLALLVCNAAAGLASRLAGGLALAAATVLSALAQVTGFQSLDSFHNSNLQSLEFLTVKKTATLIE